MHGLWMKKSSDMFQIQKGLKESVALMPLFFNFALENAIRNVPENQKELICVGHNSFCCNVDAILFPKSAFYYTTKSPSYRYDDKTLDSQQYCSTVFLDVSQAFDKVWHQGLLLKIKQILPPVYFNLPKSYNIDTS